LLPIDGVTVLVVRLVLVRSVRSARVTILTLVDIGSPVVPGSSCKLEAISRGVKEPGEVGQIVIAGGVSSSIHQRMAEPRKRLGRGEAAGLVLALKYPNPIDEVDDVGKDYALSFHRVRLLPASGSNIGKATRRDQCFEGHSRQSGADGIAFDRTGEGGYNKAHRREGDAAEVEVA
jgi:hypothetical protein